MKVKNHKSNVMLKMSRSYVDEKGIKKSEVIVSEYFETSATDSQLRDYLKSEVARLQDVTKWQEKFAGVLPSTLKRFALYIHDIDEDVRCAPIIVAEKTTLNELRSRFVESMNEGANNNKREIYRNMLRYITEKGWYFDDLSEVQWREVCVAAHPLFLSAEWSEDDRADFAKRSRQTISHGRRTGAYESPCFRPKRKRVRSSVEQADKSAPIRTPSKKVKSKH
jgi:hypothetical protein